jgi:hypothetical protein
LVYSLFAEVVLAGFVSMLNAIDGNTPTGTIGIIGFLLYLVAIVIRTFIELRPSR